MVDEPVRTAVDEEVVQQTCDEPAAARRDDGPPDPVIVTKREHYTGSTGQAVRKRELHQMRVCTNLANRTRPSRS